MWQKIPGLGGEDLKILGLGDSSFEWVFLLGGSEVLGMCEGMSV